MNNKKQIVLHSQFYSFIIIGLLLLWVGIYYLTKKINRAHTFIWHTWIIICWRSFDMCTKSFYI